MDIKKAKDNSFRKAFYHLKMAEVYFEDVIRQMPMTSAGILAKRYLIKVGWIKTDFNSNTKMPLDAIERFKQDIEGDIMFHESISRKCLGLSESQKEVLESIIDELLKGEKINILTKAYQ